MPCSYGIIINFNNGNNFNDSFGFLFLIVLCTFLSVFVMKGSYFIVCSVCLLSVSKYQLQRDSMRRTQNFELGTLIRKRKDIVENISKLNKRKQILTKNQHDYPESHPRKIVKRELLPSHQPIAAKPHKDPKEEEEETDAAKHLREELLKRNRRVFGGLAIHLKKAQSNIQAERPKIEEKNRILEQIQQKQKQKSQELVQEELARLECDINKAEAEKEDNAKQILRIQNQVLLEGYQRYSSNLQSFLFTATEPSVAWKPAKQFEAARSLLGDKQKQFERKSKEVELAITKYEQKFDYCSYMAENQREYYGNLVGNYYDGLSKYFITETEPHILWKTNKPCERLNDLLTKSQASLIQMASEFRKKCDDYYQGQMEKLKRGRQSVQPVQEEEESNSPFPYAKQQSS